MEIQQKCSEKLWQKSSFFMATAIIELPIPLLKLSIVYL